MFCMTVVHHASSRAHAVLAVLLTTPACYGASIYATGFVNGYDTSGPWSEDINLTTLSATGTDRVQHGNSFSRPGTSASYVFDAGMGSITGSFTGSASSGGHQGIVSLSVFDTLFFPVASGILRMDVYFQGSVSHASSYEGGGLNGIGVFVAYSGTPAVSLGVRKIGVAPDPIIAYTAAPDANLAFTQNGSQYALHGTIDIPISFGAVGLGMSVNPFGDPYRCTGGADYQCTTASSASLYVGNARIFDETGTSQITGPITSESGYAYSTAIPSSGVPEPNTLLLLMSAASAAFVWRGIRCHIDTSRAGSSRRV